MSVYYIDEDGNLSIKKRTAVNGTKQVESNEAKWLKGGAFADGWQFGDLTKTILGTTRDVKENVTHAVLEATENLIDTTAFGVGQVAGWFGADGFRDNVGEFIAKDPLTKGKMGAKLNKILDFTTPEGLISKVIMGDNTEGNSVLGDKADGLVQSGAHLVGSKALQMVGVPSAVTMGVNAFGSEIEQAYKNDATHNEALISGAVAAAAEILIEKISSGIKFGGKTLDEGATKTLSRNISNRIVRSILKWTGDTVGEGLEEYLTESATNVARKLTYADEMTWKDVFASEEHLDAFVGGAIMGGVAGGYNATKSGVNGVEYASGLTANEEKVVRHEYEKRVAEKTKNGEKVDKSKIWDEVIEDMEKGYISTDTIEDVLGDKTYANLKQEADEFNTLYNKEGGMSKAQQDRLAELEAKNKTKPYKALLEETKKKQAESVRSTVRFDRLRESYLEADRAYQDFQIDPDKYKGRKHEYAAKKTIQSAIDAGANNTNRVHDLVEIAASVSADTGRTFTFKSGDQIKADFIARQQAEIAKLESLKNRTAEQNAELAKMKELLAKVESGEVIIDGDISEDGIVLNLDSNKPLNRVVGHEITHHFEPGKGKNSKYYTELRDSLFAYAKTIGRDIDAELAAKKAQYAGVADANPEAELVADLVGDFLFTDNNYIKKLSVENRNVFQKIWDEIKYLAKVATAGSKEARELARLEKAFADIYRESGNKIVDTKYSITNADTDYMDAVKRGDMETAQRMVDEAAKKAGFPVRLLHGTQKFGFTVTDTSLSDDKLSFFATSDVDTAKTYSSLGGKRGITEDADYDAIDEESAAHEENARDKASALADKISRWAGYYGYVDGNYIHEQFRDIADDFERGRISQDEADSRMYEFADDIIANGYSEDSYDGQEFWEWQESEEAEDLYTEVNKTISAYFALADFNRNADSSGNYDLYGNIDGFLIIEGNGAKWNDIKSDILPDITSEEYKKYGYRGHWDKWTTRSVSKYASDNGYRGVLFKNIYDDGGKSSSGVSKPADVYSFFYPQEQVKSADPVTYDDDGDVIPLSERFNTGNKDIRYSLSDSKGRELSPAVQKRFANSKVVDENGSLKVVYHGTAAGEFFIFDKAKGSVEGDFGSGFYFTDNEADVSDHYEGGGPDFENKVARLAEQIEADEEIDYDEAQEKARAELYKGSHKFEVYLNIENPAVVGETVLFDNESYLEQYNEEDYEDYDDYIADVEQLLADDIENIVWEVEKNVDVNSTDGLADVLYNAYYDGGIGIEELKSKINDLYLEDSNGNFVGNEVTRQIIESLGYDGIIDPTVSGKWNMNMEEGTTHYIVFKPNQIKSVTNQNPTDNPDIRRSLSSQGEQFAPSKNDIYGSEFRVQEIAPVQETAPAQEESVAPVAKKSAETIRVYRGFNKSRNASEKNLTPNKTVYDYTGKQDPNNIENVIPLSYYTESFEDAQSYADMDKRMLENYRKAGIAEYRQKVMEGRDMGGVSELEYAEQAALNTFRLLHGGEPNLSGYVESYDYTPGKTLDLTKLGDVTDVASAYRVLSKSLGISELELDDYLMLEGAFEDEFYPFSLLRNTPSNNIGTRVVELAKKAGYDNIRYSEDGNSHYAIINDIDGAENRIFLTQDISPVSKNDTSTFPDDLAPAEETNIDSLTDEDAPMGDIAPVRVLVRKKINNPMKTVKPDDYTGAAPSGFDPVSHLQYEYGSLPVGENPVREDSLPKSTTGKDKVSLTARTVKGAEATPDEFVDLLDKEVVGGRFSYLPIKNTDTVKKAYDSIVQKGWEAARGEWESRVRRGEVSAELSATGELLLNNAAKAGDRKAWLSILHDYQVMGTNAGQAIQAMRILKTLTPDDGLYMIERSVEQMVEDMKLGTEIVIDEDLKQKYLDSKTDSEKDAALDALAENVASQIPSTAMDKWTALRYLNMLGNLRTQGRNIFGNLGMSATNRLKNTIASAIEAIAEKVSGGKFKRTKSAFVGRGLLKASKNDFANVEQVALNGGKFNDSMAKSVQFQQKVQDSRKIFKLMPLEKYRRATNWAMSQGDLVFSKAAYGRALAGYLKANGITETDFSKIDQQTLDEARAYAVKEAQEVTFRDNNWLSDWVSKMGRRKDTPKVGKLISEGVMPFRKTPANILLRAEEYSPLGILNATAKSIKAVKGDISGADVVNSWAKALTGTGLFALGMLLNNMGVLSGGPDDDENKEQFENQYGKQNYAIKIGDYSFTIDFLSPSAMPLLMGAQLNELRQDEDVELKDLETSLMSIADPMIEMSMLQGVNDSLDNIRYAESNMGQFLVNSCVNYLTQGLTNSFLGQLERSFEGERMTTYIDKDSKTPQWLQKALGKASAKTPGWDYQQVPYVDAWGETEDIAPLPGVLENTLSPSYISHEMTDDVYDELNRLNDAQSDINVYPQTPDKTVTFDDSDGNRHVDYNLTAEEYVELSQLQGQTQKELIEDILSSELYDGLTDKEKAKAVQLAYQYAKEYSRQEVLGADGFSSKWMSEAGDNIVNAIIAHVSDEKTFAYNYPEKYSFFMSNGISYEQYASADEAGKRAYTWAYENPGKYKMYQKLSGDYMTFYGYKSDLNGIKSDKDSSGKSITGSRKKKVVEYINNMDADYGEKIILYKSEYPSDDTYNNDIVEYLNSRNDISYDDMVTILKELGFTVDNNGNVSW